MIVKVFASLFGTRRIYFSSPVARDGFDASSKRSLSKASDELDTNSLKRFHGLSIENEPLGPIFLLLLPETDVFF